MGKLLSQFIVSVSVIGAIVFLLHGKSITPSEALPLLSGIFAAWMNSPTEGNTYGKNQPKKRDSVLPIPTSSRGGDRLP
ncbi:MAG: hypothetical protein HC773_05650 [Scytonema sp. CRU_2_7]|nr:hypothetical protein [Scytonema sp. CRU_2_7]